MADIKALWRTYAQVYDEVLRVIPYRNLLLDLVEVAEIKSGMRLLDAGSGTSNLLWALNQQDISCQVTGIDSSREMLAKATPKLKNYFAPVDLILADLNEPLITWGNANGVKFNRIIFNNSLWVLDDPMDVLRKMCAIADDGALITVSTPRPNPNVNELLDEHLQASEYAGVSREEALQQMLPRLQLIIECNERLMKIYGDDEHLPTEPQLRRWMAATGWTILELTTAYAGQNWLVVAKKATSA
jgi:ubiquinone/menaquinone biosynthesis C-methylase UbiE